MNLLKKIIKKSNIPLKSLQDIHLNIYIDLRYVQHTIQYTRKISALHPKDGVK